MTPKEIRQSLGLPLIAVAVGAHVAEGTARVYEADRESVSPPKRRALDSFYRSLASRLDSIPPQPAA